MSQNYLSAMGNLQKQLKVLEEAISQQKEPLTTIVKDWQRSHSEIETLFQTEIINVENMNILLPISLQVEIDKQLKMLGMDLTKLQTSRSPASWQKRCQQACDRFVLLNRYLEIN